MTFSAIAEIVVGILKFPDAILQLVRVLSKTPIEKHNDLLVSIAAEAQKFEETGRPQW